MKRPNFVEARVTAALPIDSSLFIAVTHPLDTMHEALQRAALLPGEVVVVVRLDDFNALCERAMLRCARQEYHDSEAEFAGFVTARDGKTYCDGCFHTVASREEIADYMEALGIKRQTPAEHRAAMLAMAEKFRQVAESITTEGADA
jgi:hypothetical protein